jgi:DNA-binding CsgD family transcriptional regulator
VKDYRRLILMKLGAKNMPHAVAISFKQGIVS